MYWVSWSSIFVISFNIPHIGTALAAATKNKIALLKNHLTEVKTTIPECISWFYVDCVCKWKKSILLPSSGHNQLKCIPVFVGFFYAISFSNASLAWHSQSHSSQHERQIVYCIKHWLNKNTAHWKGPGVGSHSYTSDSWPVITVL